MLLTHNSYLVLCLCVFFFTGESILIELSPKISNSTASGNTVKETIVSFYITNNVSVNENKTRDFVHKMEDPGCFDYEEIHLSAPEIIQKKGFPFELHQVVTKDGYILSLHRIPNYGKPVTLGFHGMTLSSRDFLLNCGRKAFGFKMWDAGFDVWLANARGNLYSRNHTKLNISDGEYWDFSVDEVIKFDVPAIIDYILRVTGQKKLNWVGYSLGSAVVLGLGTVHQEYYKKINLIFLMGTTAYVGKAKSPVLNAIAPLALADDALMTAFNRGEMLPELFYPLLRKYLPLFCLPEASLNILGVCSNFLFVVSGNNKGQANPTLIPMMLGSVPGPLSIKMLTHWFQWRNTGNFSYFKYNPLTNLKKYGTIMPPSYDLSKVTGRVVNIWAENDWLSVPEDVHKVVRELPNVVMNIKIKLESFTHLDFIYGKDADVYVYDEIISAIHKLN